MKRLALALLCAVAGCAHVESHGAAPGDDRAVLVEFCQDDWDPCRALDGYLADPAAQRSLAAVRLVRYDVRTTQGSAAYERLVGSPLSGMSTVGDVIWAYRVPLLLGIVGDRVVRRREGAPPSAEQLLAFVDDVAALGGSEATVAAALAAGAADPTTLARTARWYDVRRRSTEALPYWRRVAALDGAGAELRAEADWQLGRVERKGRARDPRAILAFATAHAGTSWARNALAIAAVLKNLAPGDVAAALRASAEAAPADPGQQYLLIYTALAAHQYDLALQLGQQLVRRTENKSGDAYGAVAEVFYYRQQPDVAIAMCQRGLTLQPDAPGLQASLARYRRSDGTPSGLVEKIRADGLFWLPRFYGDAD